MNSRKLLHRLLVTAAVIGLTGCAATDRMMSSMGMGMGGARTVDGSASSTTSMGAAGEMRTQRVFGQVNTQGTPQGETGSY